MKVKVIQAHLGEGQFPTFMKGTAVLFPLECETCFPHWYSCKIDGLETYVPECFVRDEKLIRDYNPTELIQEIGDIIEVQEIVYAWLFATNEKGLSGWIPAEAVTSFIY